MRSEKLNARSVKSILKGLIAAMLSESTGEIMKKASFISAILGIVILIAAAVLLIQYCVWYNLSFVEIAEKNATGILGIFCVMIGRVCRLVT